MVNLVRIGRNGRTSEDELSLFVSVVNLKSGGIP